MARIIYVEDDEIVGDMICNCLFDAGHIAGRVEDGDRALWLAHEKKPDLMILDCNLPGKNGIEILREIRHSPDLYDMPVLMITGRSFQGDIDVAFRAGATEYLTKPVDLDQVVATVDNILAQAEIRKDSKSVIHRRHQLIR